MLRRRRRAETAAGVEPGLCAVLVGEDPASQVYVRSKGKTAAAGMCQLRAPLAGRDQRGRTSGADRAAQRRRAVDGILVQLPLPKQIDAEPSRGDRPGKDVDGFHPVNAGVSAAAAGARRPARRSAACCWPRRCLQRSPGWKRW